MKSKIQFDEIVRQLSGSCIEWDTVKPLVKIALKVAPGMLSAGFNIPAEILSKLEDGTAWEMIEGAVEHAVSPIWKLFRKRQTDIDSLAQKMQLANTLLIFSSYFDTIQMQHPLLWKALALEDQDFIWISNRANCKYEQAEKIIEAIINRNHDHIDQLHTYYVLLNEQLKEFGSGLEGFDYVRVDWELIPDQAVKCYQGQLIKLCDKSAEFEIWANQQNFNRLIEGQEEIKGIISHETDRIIEVVQTRPTQDEMYQMHLPLITSLGVDGFVGREDELERINRAIHLRNQPIVLTGLGGMGKTELVCHFGRTYNKGRVYFVSFSGSFRETITKGIAQGIDNLLDGRLSENEIYHMVMARLRKCSENDILIIDNVDRDDCHFEDLLDEAYSALCGLDIQLILTTRFEIPRSIPVLRMTNSKLYSIFANHGVTISKTDMDALIYEVDGHTMTVDLMARMLVGSWRKVTVEDLLTALREKRLMQQVREVSTDYNRDAKQKSIYNHLRTVFNVAQMPDAAKDIMRCATLLPQNGIDIEMFGNSLTVDCQNTLDAVINHGWLSINKDEIIIHPVICLVCREELKPNDDNCEGFCIALSRQYDKTRYDRIKFRQLAQLYSKASNDLPDVNGFCANCAGLFWSLIGDYSEALKYRLKDLDCTNENGLDNELNLIIVYNNLCANYEILGYHDQAFEYGKKAITIAEKSLPPEHPTLATAYDNLANVYRSLHDYEMAFLYGSKSLIIRMKTSEDDQLDLSTSYNNLGRTYNSIGDYIMALEYFNMSLEIQEKAYSDDHITIAGLLLNIGDTYCKLGKYQDALQYQTKSLIMYQKLGLEEHPDVAKCYSNMGSIYDNLGKHNEALEYKLKALTIRKNVLCENHPDVIISYNNLSYTYAKLRDSEKALEYGFKAMEMCKKAPSVDNASLALIYNNLGYVYSILADYSIAIEYQVMALRIRQEIFPEYHPDIAQCFNNIANSYFMMKQFYMARECAECAVAIAAHFLPEGHPNLVLYCKNLNTIISACNNMG